MGIASYQRRYKRVRGKGRAHGAAYVSNPASHFTDQGADAHPADLGWCIRRRWRVIYYSYRHAAHLPLWDGVDDFEHLMADVLFRLSRDFEPFAPIRSAKVASEEGDPIDPRKDRVYQPWCRVYPMPVIEQPEETD